MKTTGFHRFDLLTTAEGFKRKLLDEWISMSREERKRRYADTARAAQIAQVSRRTIQNWVHAGEITSRRIGKKYHVYLKSLEAHLNQ